MQYQSSLFGLLRKGAALLLCLCLLAGCTNQQQEQPQLASSTGTEPEQTEESTSSHEVDAEYYLGETTFIGDSRTNGLLTYQLLPPEQVFAIDGSTQKTIREDAFIQLEPGGEYLTVEEAVAERQPSRILIAFGVNAIPLMTDEEFMEEYDILVDQLVAVSPDSKIVIQSILPVANWKYLEMPSLTNENIDYHNALLEDYAEENGYYAEGAGTVWTLLTPPKVKMRRGRWTTLTTRGTGCTSIRPSTTPIWSCSPPRCLRHDAAA